MLLGVGAPQGGSAQTRPGGFEAAEQLVALEARLDSLMEFADGMDARVEAERAAYEASTEAELDAPVERGVAGFRVRALPRDIEAAAALYGAVWAEVFAPVFGAPPADLEDAVLGYYDHRGDWNPRISEGDGMRYSVQVLNALDDPRPQAVRALMEVLLREGPLSLWEWLGEGRLMEEQRSAGGSDPRSALRDARRQLAVVRSETNVGCLSGDVEACTLSFSLRPSGFSLREVVRAWYDQEALRELLTDRRWFRGNDFGGDGPLDAAEYFTHERKGFTVPEGASIEEAEIVVLDGTDVFYDAAPASAATRMTLFTHAVQQGGEGAVERWMALPKRLPLEQALEAIAQEPVEELVAGWRARMVAEDERPTSRLPVRATLTWVALLGVLSMTSTRWRLGR